MKGILTDILLVFLLLLAAYLRIKGADVYMQDELSAISRLQFDSMAELIRLGVRPDGHPALMQVWMYCYSAIVGYDEMAMKLPSILAGVVSVGLVFRIGRTTYGRKVALLSAAMMATLQYFILYSQLARPYAIGTMFCVWQTYLLVEASHHPERRMKWGWMMLAMALSAYTHYFSMMVSIILGAGTFFLLHRANRMDHLKAVGGPMLLFLPHVPITLAQMGKSDLSQAGGWLGPPEKDFLVDFFAFLFQYQLVLIVLMAVLGGMMLLSLGRMDSQKRGLTMLFVCAGILPYVVGHIYSLEVGPVLQYSLLIFGMPLLLLAVLSPLRRMSGGVAFVSLIFLLVLNIHTLHAHRHHYETLVRQPIDHAMHEVARLNEMDQRPLVFSMTNQQFFSAYESLEALDSPRLRSAQAAHFLITDSTSLIDFEDHLNMMDQGIPIIMINAPMEFGRLLEQKREEAEIWNGNRGTVVTSFHSDLSRPWVGIKQGYDLRDDSPIPTACTSSEEDQKAGAHHFNEGSEWGPSCHYRLADLADDGRAILHLRIDFTDSVAVRDIVVVMEIKKNDQLIAWRGQDWNERGVPGSIFSSWDLEAVLADRTDRHVLDLNVYLWNKDKKERWLHAIDLMVENSAPHRYSLFEKVLEE